MVIDGVAVAVTVGVVMVGVPVVVGVVIVPVIDVVAGGDVVAGPPVVPTSSPSAGSLQAALNTAQRVKNNGRLNVEAFLMVYVDGR